MFNVTLWVLIVTLWTLQHVCATPMRPEKFSKRSDAAFTLRQAKAITSRRDLNISDSVLILKDIGAVSGSTRALLSASASDTTVLHPVAKGSSFAIDVELSGQTFELLFDTGSSDMWVAETGFQCYNANLKPVPEARCRFGPLFSGNFQGGKIANRNFLTEYGSGEQVAGILGYEDVTVAGVRVTHQEIAAVQAAYFIGDGVTSGIIGFAYSSLTNSYKGNDPAKDSLKTLLHYTNYIGNVVKQGKVDPSFSLALERAGGQSQLALGGLPTIKFKHDFTTVPLQIYEFSAQNPIEAKKYTYYTILMDGFVLDDNLVGASLDVIVDSGTTVTYLPTALAKKINQAFDPPARMRDGYWETSCNAKPPVFSIRIGGTNFRISDSELLPPSKISYDSSTGLCVTGIQSAKGTPPILGGTFLKNVVAVFDIGAAEMRFAPHEHY